MPHIKQISSRNSTFQHLEVIKRNRAKRTRFGEVLIEGVIPVNLFAERNYPVESIYFAGFETLSDWANDIISAHPEAELYNLSSELMEEISGKESASEILVLAKQPQIDASELSPGKLLLLDRPSSPGNLGTIIRTADSFGIDAVFISGHGVDPYDPKCISASRGTVFSIPIVKVESNSEIQELVTTLQTVSGFTVFGSSARGDTDIRGVVPQDRFFLIIGNETTGMAPFFHSMSDVVLTIPISGHASSLNIACATSILLYQLAAPAIP